MILKKFEILGISFIFRILILFVVFLLPIQNNIKIILIFLTDFTDCWTTKLIDKIQNNIPIRENHHCKQFSYQITDKVIDLLSYTLVCLLLPANPLYITMILYRIIGVSMFYKTRNSHWLIYFPDLFKEVIVYEMLVGPVTSHILLIIIAHKVIFEYIWHTYINHENYKKMNIKNNVS